MFTLQPRLVSQTTALAGRDTAMSIDSQHYVNAHSIVAPFPTGTECAGFGMGCFWGAERKFWSLQGVYSTAVGYSAGFTPNPTYQEVCSGKTAHNEVVLVVYYPDKISYQALLDVFWQNHNPTQGMQQGNDRGTQYRSGIYTHSEVQQQQALKSKQAYQTALTEAGYADISTEIFQATQFYYAETYHQQYLAKNPQGYCGLGGTGVCIST
jgi:peptide-methionine (S)-S-oxide reductase